MAASNALDVKALVVALINAADTGNAWDVHWGFSKAPDKTFVYVGEITWEDTSWVTNRSIEETFNVKVIINHKARRGTPTTVETSAITVSNAIQAAIKANPNLGDASIVVATYKPRRVDSWPSDDFLESQLEAEIHVKARF